MTSESESEPEHHMACKSCGKHEKSEVEDVRWFRPLIVWMRRGRHDHSHVCFRLHLPRSWPGIASMSSCAHLA